MSFVKAGISAIGKLLIVTALAGTFLVGMASVFYLSLKGEEVEIPKIIGKNVNEGEDALADLGLRMKKVAYRYSTEEPNTILEQRPAAGSAAKTGLMVSVILSKPNADGSEAPITVEDKEKEAKKKEEELKELPELETDKAKDKPKKTDKKTAPKTRDVIKDKKTEDEKSDSDEKKEADAKDAKSDADKGNSEKSDQKTSGSDKTKASPSPKSTAKPAGEKSNKTDEKPKASGDTRTRRVPPSN